MKLKYPAAYGPEMTVKSPPEIINAERAQARNKGGARYPHTPIRADQYNPTTGHMGRRAYTPGGPAGS